MSEDEINKIITENNNLRALVSRLTDCLNLLSIEVFDPGADILAAIHCGRNFIFG